MTITHVRASVQAGLQELGFETAVSLGEKYLIRSGCFAGVLFEFEGIKAIYFFDADQIKFVGKSGEVLKPLSLEHRPDVARKAA